MLLQAGGRHILVAPLLLHVVRVRERVHSNVGHVTGRHVALGYRPALLGGQVSACRLLGGVNRIVVVHTVVAGRRFGCVQACLSSMLVG